MGRKKGVPNRQGTGARRRDARGLPLPETRAEGAQPWTPPRATLRHGVWRRDPADVLTGRPVDLSRDEPTILVRHWDDTRNDEAPLVATEYVPLKPTVQRIDRGDGRPDVTRNRAGEEVLCADREGGKAWSHEMDEFMRGVLPNSVAAERKGRTAWWSNPYIVGRMRRHLGDDAVNAMLTLQRGTASIEQVAKSYGHNRDWLLAQFAMVQRLLPHYYPDHTLRRMGLPAKTRKRVPVPIHPLPPEEMSAEPSAEE